MGFRPWQQHWLGVLVTPWFMNLMLFPRVVASWHSIAERDSRDYVFPAGVFTFLGSRDAVLGDWQACSLFSPMFDFADRAGARATAAASLDALFDSGQRSAGEITPAAAATSATPQRAPTKREFPSARPGRIGRDRAAGPPLRRRRGIARGAIAGRARRCR